MSKFQIGDIAIIISAVGAEHLIGKSVEIFDYIPIGQEYEMSEDIIFDSDNKVSWAVQFTEKQFIDDCITDKWVFYETSLMPLKGDFKMEEEESDVLLSLSN